MSQTVDILDTYRDDEGVVTLDYKAEYERAQQEIVRLHEENEKLKITISRERNRLHRYLGAIRMMEMLTGDRFDG